MTPEPDTTPDTWEFITVRLKVKRGIVCVHVVLDEDGSVFATGWDERDPVGNTDINISVEPKRWKPRKRK